MPVAIYKFFLVVVLLLGTIFIVLAITIFIYAQQVQGLAPESDESSAVAVLFGGFAKETELNHETVLRLDFSAGLARKYQLPLLCVGGFRSWQRASGARLMRHYLQQYDYSGAILVDDNSWDTISNLWEIERIANERGWHKVIIATSAVHAFRAAVLGSWILSRDYLVASPEETRHGVLDDVIGSMRESGVLMATFIIGMDRTSRLVGYLRMDLNTTGNPGFWQERGGA